MIIFIHLKERQRSKVEFIALIFFISADFDWSPDLTDF